MRRRVLPAVLLCAFALAVVTAACSRSPASSGSFIYRGLVTHVIDGDTVDVRLRSGRLERIRVLGIDTPERGVCFSRQATTRARRLTLARAVVLRGDATQATRDRHGRLLAYVGFEGGRDLGFELIAGGFAKVYVFSRAFERLPAYREAETRARRGSLGLWLACRGRLAA
jgi:endonuclease YncB( thermonuclease family)